MRLASKWLPIKPRRKVMIWTSTPTKTPHCTAWRGSLAAASLKAAQMAVPNKPSWTAITVHITQPSRPRNKPNAWRRYPGSSPSSAQTARSCSSRVLRIRSSTSLMVTLLAKERACDGAHAAHRPRHSAQVIRWLMPRHQKSRQHPAGVGPGVDGRCRHNGARQFDKPMQARRALREGQADRAESPAMSLGWPHVLPRLRPVDAGHALATSAATAAPAGPMRFCLPDEQRSPGSDRTQWIGLSALVPHVVERRRDWCWQPF